MTCQFYHQPPPITPTQPTPTAALRSCHILKISDHFDVRSVTLKTISVTQKRQVQKAIILQTSGPFMIKKN